MGNPSIKRFRQGSSHPCEVNLIGVKADVTTESFITFMKSMQCPAALPHIISIPGGTGGRMIKLHYSNHFEGQGAMNKFCFLVGEWIAE